MKERIKNIIFESIDEFNDQYEGTYKLEKKNDTILYGQKGKLDSLGLVNFIMITEQQIEDEFGISITIADEKAMSQKTSPFKSVETLSQYISTLIKE